MMANLRVEWLRRLRRLRRDRRGVSVVEFALMLPILIMVGAGGLEFINLVLANQKIERIASITADNVARNTLAPSERSFVDTFAGVNEIAQPFNFNANGRVIMTGVIGVSVNGSVVGKVVWQRCSGSLGGVASTVGSPPSNPANWSSGPNAKQQHPPAAEPARGGVRSRLPIPAADQPRAAPRVADQQDHPPAVTLRQSRSGLPQRHAVHGRHPRNLLTTSGLPLAA